MTTPFNNNVENTVTDPEIVAHPVQAFLAECGIKTDHFPRMQLLVELNDPKLRAGQVYIPLRVPQAPGFVYESLCRITRVLEVPASDSSKGTHRKFFEIEWVVADEPTPDEENHSVFSFLARELDCPACKHLFIPDVDIIDENAVRIVCPQCIHHWVVRVESSSEREDSNVESLLDQLHRDSAVIRKRIQDWDDATETTLPSEFYSYFPYNFEAWSPATSLEWLFEDCSGWTAISQGGRSEFEILAKGLLNVIVLGYFRSHRQTNIASQLEHTDIQRKSDIQKRDEIQKKVVEEIFTAPEDLDVTIPATRKAFVPTEWNPPSGVRVLPSAPKPEYSSNKFLLTGVFSILGIGACFGLFFLTSSFVSSRFSSVEIPKKSLEAKQNNDKNSTVIAAVSDKAVEKPSTPVEHQKLVEAQSRAIIESDKSNSEVKTATEVFSTEDSEESNAMETKKKLASNEHQISQAAIEAKKQEAAALAKKRAEYDRQLATIVDSNFRQGMLHLKLQQSKEAILAFRKVLSMDPSNAPSYRGLGLAYVYDQRYEEAISALEKYVSLSKESSDRKSVIELLQTLKHNLAKNSLARE